MGTPLNFSAGYGSTVLNSVILVGKELDPYEYSMFRTLLPTAFADDIRRFNAPDLPDKAVESFCTFLIIFF